MPPPTQPQHLETVKQAAARYGVHPATIRRRIASGHLTVFRFGPKLIRVDADEVDALLRTVAEKVS